MGDCRAGKKKEWIFQKTCRIIFSIYKIFVNFSDSDLCGSSCFTLMCTGSQNPMRSLNNLWKKLTLQQHLLHLQYVQLLPLSNSKTFASLQTKTPHPLNSSFPFLPPQPLSTTSLLSISMNVLY